MNTSTKRQMTPMNKSARLVAILLALLALALPCLAQTGPNPSTNHVCKSTFQDIHLYNPEFKVQADAGGPYALTGTNLEIAVAGTIFDPEPGYHQTVEYPCPCKNLPPIYYTPYEVWHGFYTYEWMLSLAPIGTPEEWFGAGFGSSFSETANVSTTGVYSLDVNIEGFGPCGLCDYSAGASTNFTVYQLIATNTPWLGLDRRDEGLTNKIGGGEAFLTPPDPATYKWELKSERDAPVVCTLEEPTYDLTVKYKTTDKEKCSKNFLDQKLEVTATITSPKPFSILTTTNFTVVKIDVAFEGTGEELEEKVPVWVQYVEDAPDGTLSYAGMLSMTNVSITCTPTNLPYGEIVTIDVPEGFLYEKIGDGVFIPASSTYEASEVSSKQFYVHGHVETNFTILVTHPTSQAKDQAKVRVSDNPFEEECTACEGGSCGSTMANESIYFAQSFGRTPWVAGAPSGTFRVHEKISTDRLGNPAMFKYDHPVSRKVLSRNDSIGYIAIIDSQGHQVSYMNGSPVEESSGKDLQCVIGTDGLVTETLPDRTRVVYGADKAVLKLITPEGVEVMASELGIDVVRNGDGIRQVRSKTDGLLDVVCPQGAYETVVSWYPPSAVSQQPDASGLYTFSGNPAKTFTFKRTTQVYYKWVSGPKCLTCEVNGGHQAYDYIVCDSRYTPSGVNYGLTLDERRGTEFLFQYEWKFDRYDNDWTFTKGSGDDFVKDRLIHVRTPGTSTVTRVRSDASGKLSTHDKKVYLNDRYGTKLIRRSTVESDGNERLGYSAERIGSGSLAGRLSATASGYGDTTSYEHDGYGRIISESTVIARGIAQVTGYGYSEAPDAQGFIDRRPISVVVYQDGVLTSCTDYSYKGAFAVNGSGVLGLCDTVTRRDPANGVSLKSYTHYYSATLANAIERGRIRLTVNPDGSATHYAYAAGENNSWTETLTQGYFDASVTGASSLDELFSVLPGKSTRTVSTHDFRGDVVRTESHVHTGNGFSLAGWETYSYNIMHKRLNTYRHDGTSDLSNWICTGPVWQRNADGTCVTNTFDTAKRIKTSTRYTPFGNVATTYTYDADDRVVSQTTATNGVTVGCGIGCGATYSEFDAQGRTVLSVDAQGRTNRTAYSADNLVVTHTDPAGAVVVESYATDGLLLSRTGNVMRAEYYTKGVDAVTSTRWEKTAYCSPAGPDYSKSYYNALGQLVLQERPGFGGATLKTVYAYNAKGQLESESGVVQGGTGTVDLPVTTYAYNQLGASIATTQAVANIYRVQSSDSAFIYENGIVQQTSVSVQSCSDLTIPAMTNASITRLYPLENGLLAESRMRDVRGNETVQKVAQNTETYVRTTTVSNATSVLPAISLSLAGLTLSQTDQHGCTTTFGYDALMRQISAESRSGPNNERLTGTYTRYNVIGQVDYTEDAYGTRTVYGYEPGTGRRISTTQVPPPSSLLSPASVQTAYDRAGRMVASWGATYPVAYEYDTAGHMTAMYTYRGTNEAEFINAIRQSGNNAITQLADCTRWLYDEATGLLTNKLYADNRGPSYSYTALGQLATRKWARLSILGQQLLTQYAYDNFGSLTNTAYSDGTPSVSFTINALGQMKSVTDASGTRTLDYAADGQMIAEALAFNTSLFTLHEKFDTLGRNQGYALSNGVEQITGTMQGFDQYGHLNQVSVDGITNAFTYGYLEGSHLQKTFAMPNGVTRTFGYEANRDLLTMILHSNATDRLVQRDFSFDGIGRLSNRTLFRANEVPVQPDAFAYNSRSELTNAIYQITQSGTNAIRQFSYDFDPIGNRNSATEFGTNTAYVASALNQYTNINPIYPVNPVENFTPEFDADGNQTLLKTTTGIWHVSYNAENRPILFSNDTTNLEMAYDYMGRRFEYKETVSGTLTRHERYLYSGYLQIAALDMLTSTSVKHTIAWDASERVATRPLSLQIGANAYFYSFDQVKNVTELFDCAAAIAATYDYSPFGQVIASIGAVENPITFSSEVADSKLGLQYYNYRHLNLLDGRWVNRDPIGERGGVNIYEFVKKSTLNNIDVLGLSVPVTISPAVGMPFYNIKIKYDKFGLGSWMEGYTDPLRDVEVKTEGKKKGRNCCEITIVHIYYNPKYRYYAFSDAKFYVMAHELKHIDMFSAYLNWTAFAQTKTRTCKYGETVTDEICKIKAHTQGKLIAIDVQTKEIHTSNMFDNIMSRNRVRDVPLMEQLYNLGVGPQIASDLSKGAEDWECCK